MNDWHKTRPARPVGRAIIIERSAQSRRGVSREPMHVEVANHLRDLIVEGQLREGERINENDLAEILGVSRTPLRDALQGEGLIVIEPHKGTFVSVVTAAYTAKLFEALAGVERIGGEAATRTATEDQLDWLAGLHREMFALHADADRSAYFNMNEQIHRAFLSLSGNDILIDIHAKLIVGAKRVRLAALREQNRWDESVAEHKAILSAMQAREAEKAGKLIEYHVKRTGEAVCAYLEPRESEAARPRRRGTYERRRGFAE